MEPANLRRSERVRNQGASVPKDPSSPETPGPQPRKDSDYDYSPSQENDRDNDNTLSSEAYISPNRNVQWKEKVRKEARDAVLEDSPHGDCCAICGKSNIGGKTHNIAHLLDQALAGDKDTIRRLECHWGLKKGTFFLHSRFNMFILCPDCHSHLDKGILGVIPLREVLLELKRFTSLSIDKRRKNPANNLFRYNVGDPAHHRVIFLRWPVKMPFAVYVQGDNDMFKIKSYRAPFKHHYFSSIELHVNPFYLTWNMGYKLMSEDIDLEELDVSKSVREDLFTVRELFTAWSNEAPAPQESSRRAKRPRDVSPSEEALARKTARSTQNAASSSRANGPATS